MMATSSGHGRGATPGFRPDLAGLKQEQAVRGVPQRRRRASRGLKVMLAVRTVPNQSLRNCP
jgi:hypothetical protein